MVYGDLPATDLFVNVLFDFFPQLIINFQTLLICTVTDL